MGEGTGDFLLVAKQRPARVNVLRRTLGSGIRTLQAFSGHPVELERKNFLLVAKDRLASMHYNVQLSTTVGRGARTLTFRTPCNSVTAAASGRLCCCQAQEFHFSWVYFAPPPSRPAHQRERGAITPS